MKPVRAFLVPILALVGLLLSPLADASASNDDSCAAWLRHRAAFGAPGDAHACIQKDRASLDVLILPRANSLAEGADVEVDVVVWFGELADAARIRVEGSGALAGVSEDFVRSGGFEPGDTLEFDVRTARREGEGSLRVTVAALDADDEPIHMAAAELFARNEGADTWLSHLGTADLRLQRMRDLLARGDLDADSARRAREAAVGSEVEADRTPLQRRRRTPLEQRLDAAFAPAVEALQGADSGGIEPAATVTITVEGKIEWTDSAGTKHGAPLVTVEIRDDDTIGSELVTTTMTNSAGEYSVTFSHDDGIGAGNPDLFVRALTRSPVAEIKSDRNSDNTYFMQSPINDETPGGSTLSINLVAGTSADNQTAFSVHHGLVLIGGYASTLAGSLPSRLDVVFPSTGSNVSRAGGMGSFMNLLRLDRWDWDVQHHEYGHYFTTVHAMANSPGGPHSSSSNLWQTRMDKSKGIRLAWGEGWPTFFGTAGQQSTGSAGLGIPNVGDTRYTDTEDSTLDYSVETNTGKGEDNELSVTTVMWDLFDSAGDGPDEVSFSDGFLFSTLKAAAVTTVGAAWEAIAATQTDQQKPLVGAVFGYNKIAPVPTAPADNYDASGSASPPTFKWDKNGAGPNPLDDFKIVFFTSDFSSVVFEKELGDVDTWTPTNSEWNTILSGDDIVKWVVQGKNTSAPATPGGSLGRYWSAARSIGGISIAFVIDDTGSMGEEITAVVSALQSYIDLVEASLGDGESAPTIQLVTFKDDVTTRITSNDLAAVRSSVGALFASGGGDCPEFSAHALQVASQNIAPGGTILLATDASAQPGVDVGAVIANLRTKGVTVNTILSGDCAGISSATADPNQIADSGPQAKVPPSLEANKDGDDDEPPHEPIVDPGQDPIDDHGDTFDTATRIEPDAPALTAAIGFAPDAEDWFAVALEAGKTYGIQHQLVSGSNPQVALYGPDGTSFLRSDFMSTLPRQIVYTPTETGDHFIAVTRFASTVGSVYELRVTEDPLTEFAGSALELFSTVSAETGGAFLVRDGVNFGDDSAYVAAMFNVMASTLGPAVLSANPGEVPQNVKLAVALTGRNTNWRSGTTVDFSGNGIDVESVEIISPTSISVLIEISAGANLGFRDVTVETPLGGDTEVAEGIDVVEVVPEITFPATLSVEPFGLSRGDVETLLIRGVNTDWGAGTEVTILDSFTPDSSITVDSVDVISKKLIEVDVTVSEEADLGFRTVQVVTGFEFLTKDRAFIVNSGDVAIPQIRALFPTGGSRGKTVEVMVEGSNTSFEDGVTTASFGAGITVTDVEVVNATEANVTVEIDEDAPLGFRDVVLSTGEENAVLIDGFFVSDFISDVMPLPANGKFVGCLDPNSEILYEFTVPVGQAIKNLSLGGMKDKAAGQGKLIAEVALIDPRETETVLGRMKSSGKKKGKKIKDNDIRLPLQGTHFLAVRSVDNTGGCYSGKAKLGPTQGSLKLGLCIEPGDDAELAFSVLPGSTIAKLTVEGKKRTGKNKQRALDPAVELEAPSGADEVLPQTDKKKVVAKSLALAEEGDYVLDVADAADAGGCFDVKLKVQQGGGS